MAQAPRLPDPPQGYERNFMSRLFNQLRLYFAQIDAAIGEPTKVNLSTIPTDADVADLTTGTVYLDTADNSLKVKV